MTINKTEALKRLEALEKETGELRKIIDAPEKVTDRVKTFQDACKEMDVIPAVIQNLLSYGGTDRAMIASVAHMKLQIIANALNEGWKPDWKNSGQQKYYPWFDMSSGSGLSFYGFDCYYSRSGVGSRLCFKSRELAEYAGKQFTAIYQDLMCF